MIRVLKNRRYLALMLVAATVSLSACSSAVSDQAALSLDKGQGLLGLELVTGLGDVNYQVQITGGAFGTMLKMNNAPKGESVYLYKLPAGHYCIEALYLTGSDQYMYPVGKKPCFSVTAGRLTYGGTVENNAWGFYSVDMHEFLRALKQIYPKVYAHYVKGSEPMNKPAA